MRCYVPLIAFFFLVAMAAPSIVRAFPDDATEESSNREDTAPVFSGPQKGERLVPFRVLGVYGDDAGKELDPLALAGEKPILLVFVHELTRPSIGLARALTDYAHDRRDDLAATVVWLDDDRSAAAAYLRRARRSLDFRVPVGIAVDGEEGPGAYGLNRRVALTILLGKEGRVTANFALVQPSDTDLPSILEEVVELVGGKAPSIGELRAFRGTMEGAMERADPRLRRSVRRLLSDDLETGEVKRSAARIEEGVGEDRARRRDLGIIAAILIARDGFDERGTEAARSKVREWAREHGPSARRSMRRRNGDDPRLAGMLRRVIRKDARPEDVEEAAAAVESYVDGNAARERRLGKIARRVVGSKVFAEGGYGTEPARKRLRAWARKYGGEQESPPRAIDTDEEGPTGNG